MTPTTATETMRDNLEMPSFLPTEKQRPKTTACVARRMVSHALGVRIQVSPKQKEIEENDLNEAKGMSPNSSSKQSLLYKSLAVCSRNGSFSVLAQKRKRNLKDYHPPPDNTDN